MHTSLQLLRPYPYLKISKMTLDSHLPLDLLQCLNKSKIYFVDQCGILKNLHDDKSPSEYSMRHAQTLTRKYD